MATFSTDTLNNISASLTEIHRVLQSISPNSLYKTLESKNITFEDWNTSVAYVGRCAEQLSSACEHVKTVIEQLKAESNDAKEYTDSVADTKLDKLTNDPGNTKVYTHNGAAQSQMQVSGNADPGTVPVRTSDGTVRTRTPKDDSDSTPKSYVDAVKLALEGSISEINTALQGLGASLSLNNEDYKITLKNADGTVLSTIDLPLESVVVNGSYADGNITLTLQNGNTVVFPIEDLIDGLVSSSITINGKALTSDITLTHEDVGAVPSENAPLSVTAQEIVSKLDAIASDITRCEEPCDWKLRKVYHPRVYAREDAFTFGIPETGGIVDSDGWVSAFDAALSSSIVTGFWNTPTGERKEYVAHLSAYGSGNGRDLLTNGSEAGTMEYYKMTSDTECTKQTVSYPNNTWNAAVEDNDSCFTPDSLFPQLVELKDMYSSFSFNSGDLYYEAENVTLHTADGTAYTVPKILVGFDYNGALRYVLAVENLSFDKTYDIDYAKDFGDLTIFDIDTGYTNTSLDVRSSKFFDDILPFNTSGSVIKIVERYSSYALYETFIYGNNDFTSESDCDELNTYHYDEVVSPNVTFEHVGICELSNANLSVYSSLLHSVFPDITVKIYTKEISEL